MAKKMKMPKTSKAQQGGKEMPLPKEMMFKKGGPAAKSKKC